MDWMGKVCDLPIHIAAVGQTSPRLQLMAVEHLLHILPRPWWSSNNKKAYKASSRGAFRLDKWLKKRDVDIDRLHTLSIYIYIHMLFGIILSCYHVLSAFYAYSKLCQLSCVVSLRCCFLYQLLQHLGPSGMASSEGDSNMAMMCPISTSPGRRGAPLQSIFTHPFLLLTSPPKKKY